MVGRSIVTRESGSTTGSCIARVAHKGNQLGDSVVRAITAFSGAGLARRHLPCWWHLKQKHV